MIPLLRLTLGSRGKKSRRGPEKCSVGKALVLALQKTSSIVLQACDTGLPSSSKHNSEVVALATRPELLLRKLQLSFRFFIVPPQGIVELRGLLDVRFTKP